MELIIWMLLPAVGIWAWIFFRRVSVYSWAIAFLIGTSAFTAEFYALNVGGLTWTVDRVVFLCLLMRFLIGWKLKEYQLLPIELEDCLAIAFTVWLCARTLSQPLEAIAPHQPDTLMHMINGYTIPLILYIILRTARPDGQDLRPALVMLGLFGIYLSITAAFEVAKLWGLVFPKFIADPELGIHFGRARGPMLQSVRLGMCLLACWLPLFVFTVWLNPRSRNRWIIALATLPVFAGGVFLTYTRSIWMAFALVIAMLVVLCLQGRTRQLIVVTGSMACILLLAILGPSLVAFKREYSAAETRESTIMRAAFAYVSIQMIKERPVAGYGFNQFNAANREFLSDRSSELRLESIRGYVHHNSFLSLIVDLGIIGFGLYLAVVTAWLKRAWALWKNTYAPRWCRAIALIALCLAGSHFIQMAFHEVSFSTIENGILFSAFGLVVGCSRRLDRERLTAEPNSARDGQAFPAAER
jgi:O-antigen ligase